MIALSKELETTGPNPLDMIEQIATSHDWLYERSSDRDIAVEVNGHWCDYRMFVSWHADVQAVLFACAFDMRVPERKSVAIHPLLANINERLLVDVRAGVESTDGKWRVWGWVRNVTDKHYWNQSVHVNDVLLRYTGMPRTYGVSLSMRFGE